LRVTAPNGCRMRQFFHAVTRAENLFGRVSGRNFGALRPSSLAFYFLQR
jgi:hypothetical protein